MDETQRKQAEGAFEELDRNMQHMVKSGEIQIHENPGPLSKNSQELEALAKKARAESPDAIKAVASESLKKLGADLNKLATGDPDPQSQKPVEQVQPSTPDSSTQPSFRKSSRT